MGVVCLMYQTHKYLDRLSIWDRTIQRRIEKKLKTEQFLRIGGVKGMSIFDTLSQF